MQIFLKSCICLFNFVDILSQISGPVVHSTSNSAELKNTHELLSLRQDLDREIGVHETCLEELDNVLSSLAKVKIESFNGINTNRVNTYESRCETLKSHIQ